MVLLDRSFIHGLQKNQCCWPRDLLPHDIPLSGRVVSWGYDAQLVSVAFSRKPSTANIQAHARGLLADVNRYREQQTSVNHKIIFIGHAVVASANNLKALCESMMGTDNLYRNVVGILFMGTPHRGLELARMASTLGSIVSGLGVGSKSPVLKQLKPNSEVLQNVNMQFRRVLQRAPIGICSAFETRKSPGIGLVVDQPAATFGHAEEILLPLDTDHVHLNKFLDRKDANYRRVFGVLEQWAKQIIEEDLRIETPVAEPMPRTDPVEIVEGNQTTEAYTPHDDDGSPVIQTQDLATDDPSRMKLQAEDLAAMWPSQTLERTKVLNLSPPSPPRSFGSSSTTTKDGIDTISTVASSVSLDSRYDVHNRSVTVEAGVIEGLKAAVSTTANAATPAPSTIITGLGAGLAGTALVIQGVTARQALTTARSSAAASKSSANTAKDALALNRLVFEHTKVKDQNAIVSRPKPPPNDGLSPLPAGQDLELKDEMFPTLGNVSLTFAGPSKKNDDGDQDGDHPHHIAGNENLPDNNQNQLGKRNGNRVQKPSSAQQTLFQHEFKSFKPNLSTPRPSMSIPKDCTGIEGSASGKIRSPEVLPADGLGAVLVQQADLAISIATEEKELRNTGESLIGDTPRTGSEEDVIETMTSEPSTETSRKDEILLAAADKVPIQYSSSSPAPAVDSVQHETATSDTIDEESQPAEQEFPIVTESDMEHSTAGKELKPALSLLSSIDEGFDQACVSSAQSTLGETENDEKEIPVPRLVESSNAVELDMISQSPNAAEHKLVSTTLPDWTVDSGQGGSGARERGLDPEASQDCTGKFDDEEGVIG
ncbi:hypothetical protein VTL71DRAFT_12625 [Oculimacula yallundae]|uniref:DUF676 domain-containing protein n=1 Tax=Oculimacula yallundae TaxID=86028 RepID=A0ABR4CN40_9HELO